MEATMNLPTNDIQRNWYMKCGVNNPQKPIKSTELKNKKEGGENLLKSTQ